MTKEQVTAVLNYELNELQNRLQRNGFPVALSAIILRAPEGATGHFWHASLPNAPVEKLRETAGVLRQMADQIEQKLGETSPENLNVFGGPIGSA